MQQNDIPRERSHRRSFWWLVLILGSMLAILFSRSFSANQVLFANDGPLGLLSYHADQFLSTLSGAWSDLNWVGGQGLGSLPNISSAMFYFLGPFGQLKFNHGASLFVLGLGAWFCLRQFGLGPMACLLGGLAAALNSSAFSNTCWGLPPWSYARALALVAIGLLVARRGCFWMRALLAGAALGVAVAEGSDLASILCIYVAAFAVFQSFVTQSQPAKGLGLGILRVAVVAGFAMLVAAQAVSTLIGTQIKGVVGTQQDQRTKEERWDFATQWSLPKTETLRVIIPGLFGYRMDNAEGGAYWGTVGQTPGWEQHHQGAVRSSGSGEYAGVLVALLGAWAIALSFRKKGSPYTDLERKMIWFWSGAAAISLLLAFGRHAPFYRLVYLLPYFSTIRNPIKFMHPFHLALGILFGFGLEGLSRLYLSGAVKHLQSVRDQLKAWWAAASGFERKWFGALGALLGASLLGLLLFSSSRPGLLRYLESTGFSSDMAASIVSFSTGEQGWFLLFLAVAAVLMTLIACGVLGGKRARVAWICLGLLVVADLARANSPWIIYYDYQYKYATNPVIDQLRQKPYEQRVKIFQFPVNEALSMLQQLYQVEWLQHLFPYYGIQSLDVTQEPRVAADNAAFRAMFRTTNAALISREWELTNTRYLLGLSGGFVSELNRMFDPVKQRFQVKTAFELAPKNAHTQRIQLEDLTAVLKPEGRYAVIEFTGALPRAKLYANWQVATNDEAALKQLADLNFDPHQTVLVAQPVTATPSATNAPSGTVEITEYVHKYLKLTAKADTATILLLNEKYDPSWRVWVDGQPQTVLRCNYLMRGVSLPAGSHTVEFRFQPPTGALYVSLAAIAVSLVLGLALVFSKRDETADIPHESSGNVSK